MTSWVFDPRPRMEWRFPGRIGENDLPGPEELFRVPAETRGEPRFPQDPLVEYYEYIDGGRRRSFVACITFGPDRSKASEIVELCWKGGIPVMVEFDHPPDWEDPYWRRVLRIRTIERPREGRLCWQPMISWFADSMTSKGISFEKWFHPEKIEFRLPLVRLVLSRPLSDSSVVGFLGGVGRCKTTSRIKILSFPIEYRARTDVGEKKGVLAWFQPGNHDLRSRDKVIDLFQKEVPG